MKRSNITFIERFLPFGSSYYDFVSTVFLIFALYYVRVPITSEEKGKGKLPQTDSKAWGGEV
jgi:hypothetical protein